MHPLITLLCSLSSFAVAGWFSLRAHQVFKRKRKSWDDRLFVWAWAGGAVLFAATGILNLFP